MTTRIATSRDSDAIALLAETTGLFPADMLADFIAPFLNGDPGHIWFVHDLGAGPVGFCYMTLEFLTEGTWNMKALGVHPDHQRTGAGRSIVATAETWMQNAGHRVMVIETSSDPAQSAARAFYPSTGYTLVGTIPEFWGPGDDKLIYSKTLA